MSKAVKEYYNITDREWSGMSPGVKTKKIQSYSEVMRKKADLKAQRKMEDVEFIRDNPEKKLQKDALKKAGYLK